jgi:hypothetical protein
MLNIRERRLCFRPWRGADDVSGAVHLAAAAFLVLLTSCEWADRADDATRATAVERGGTDPVRSTDPAASRPGPIEVNGTLMPTPMPPRRAVRVADRLQQYLTRVLGEPSTRGSLHRHIREVTVGLHVAAIHTDLSPGELDKVAAERICLVASWFRGSPEGRHVTALDIEVYGQAGDLIAAYDETPYLGVVRGRSGVLRQGPSAIRPGGVVPSPTPGQSVLDGGSEAS